MFEMGFLQLQLKAATCDIAEAFVVQEIEQEAQKHSCAFVFP